MELAFIGASRQIEHRLLQAYDDLLVDDDEAHVLERRRLEAVAQVCQSAQDQSSMIVVIAGAVVQEACVPINGRWLSSLASCNFHPDVASEA